MAARNCAVTFHFYALDLTPISQYIFIQQEKLGLHKDDILSA